MASISQGIYGLIYIPRINFFNISKKQQITN